MRTSILKHLAVACVVVLSMNAPAMADKNYQHFESKPATNLRMALCNLVQYNEKLGPLLEKDSPSALDLSKVHELSYTLENALIQLQSDLKQMALDLEDVHLASESMNAEVVKAKGAAYLQATTTLTNETGCE